MSDRERWIVYPLILFAFLLAARDKYVQPDRAEFRVLQCEELHVVSDSGKSLINLYGSLDDAGVMVLYSHGQGGEPGDMPQVDPLARQRNVGRPVVELGADGHLGFLTVFGYDGQIDLKLGHDRTNKLSGLYALDRDEGEPVETEAGAQWGTLRTWEAAETQEEAVSEAQPDEAQPDEAQPDEAQPDEAQPDEAQPDEAQPDEAQPDEAQPDEAQPDEAQPDEAQPDEAQPDEAQPDTAGSESDQESSGASQAPN